MREGDPAPGTAGATFGNTASNWFPGISPTSLTRSGRYEFTTGLMGGDVIPGVNDRALYAGTVGGALTLIARGGQSCPRHRCVLPGVQPVLQPDQRRGRCRVPGHPDRRHDGPDQQLGHLDLEVRHAEPGRALRRPGSRGSRRSGDAGDRPGNDLRHLHRLEHGLQRPRADRRHRPICSEATITSGHRRQASCWPGTRSKGLFLAARAAEDIEGVPGNVRTSRLFWIHPVQQLGRRLPRSGKERDARPDGLSHRRGRRRDARSELLPIDGLRHRLRRGRLRRSRHEGQRVQRPDAAGRIRRERHRLQRREPRGLQGLLPGCRWGWLRRRRVRASAPARRRRPGMS